MTEPEIIYSDEHGGFRARRGKVGHDGTPVSAMLHPGVCRWCRRIYDGGKVEVIARYADCSVWKAPCCGVTADDRPEALGGSFTALPRP